MGLFDFFKRKNDDDYEFEDDYDYYDDDRPGPKCMNCGDSLRGGEFTDAWSMGSNSSASVRCPHCGYDNYYDTGDDD